MGSAIVGESATVQCDHGGSASASSPSQRVKVDGEAAVTQSATYSVSGCSFTTPAGVPLPCVTGTFTTAAKRVKAGGEPLLLEDSQATCVPTAGALSIASTQSRVKAE